MRKRIIDRIISSHIPIPMCVVSESGKIIKTNEHMGKVFLYRDIDGADFFALTGVRIKDLVTEEDREFVIERNGRKFVLLADKEPTGEDGMSIVFFRDVSGYEELKMRYDAERIIICRINIDNYDEFTDTVSPETGISVTGQVDKMIRKWASERDGSIEKVKDTLYSIYFHGARLEEMIKGKFAILDEVRAISTGADFPLTLSMGIGVGGKTIAETKEFAMAALDLALGRGGDQAVVKEDEDIRYFGGKTQSIDKGSKGKSRIIALALGKLVDQAHEVLIMGHRHADMDAFGAALGIYRICMTRGTQAHIVIDEVPDSLRALYDQVRATQVYDIISTDKAREIADENSLVVVVDTQRPTYIEAPDLLKKTNRIVVIDHHRRGDSYIEDATLGYIETYASSASELVTEMLEYVIPSRKNLVKLEAEALLAGIYLDTNRFAVKTGVRTFEAAAWLRRAGADTTEVKRFFQTDLDTFKVRARAIAAAEFHEGGIATSICEGNNEDMQVINAQVADELLNIGGIRASFVAGVNDRGITCISARSLGEVNVQVLVEKLGGGGHLTTAGAQCTDRTPQEMIDKILEQLYKEKKDDSHTETGR